ncbi:MAG: ABC transporter ATP-binding protein [Candidatus Fischerbacteria bacterium RBG_13_37_8]|uniref:ABC transporter ATP-binding protein n=1 Tax=Candidatus Fischerbacteria bacterium RBG_13_37_8 TaxID=1817863 RepID=A0A1F5VGP0_9BACT|nr:MAG: ABC transporter ATP-binding protein [Candidatus Fischerbacteria bacterium RBG_13_37_8]
MQLLLEIKELCKSFQSGNVRIQVIDKLNVQVHEGEMIAIVGESGVGKTTLLNLIGALDSCDSGEILFEGNNILELSRQELARYRNENIGFVFQFHYLLPEFNALENAMLPALINGQIHAIASERAMMLLEELQLKARWHHKAGELSGGEQQRVAVARALINNPKIMLADEPTGNLDEKTAGRMFELFRTIHDKRNFALIIATHNIKLAKTCDRIYLMQEGKLQACDKSTL